MRAAELSRTPDKIHASNHVCIIQPKLMNDFRRETVSTVCISGSVPALDPFTSHPFENRGFLFPGGMFTKEKNPPKTSRRHLATDQSIYMLSFLFFLPHSPPAPPHSPTPPPPLLRTCPLQGSVDVQSRSSYRAVGR